MKNKDLRFTKMQGAGNDYIYINGFVEQIDNPSALAIELSNRQYGIGSDGLVLILPSSTCDFRMQMFNADGSEAEMCGNASRCIGKWVYDNKLTFKKEITLETKAGVKYITLLDGDEKRRMVSVDMGEPILDPQQIVVNIEDTAVLNKPIQVKNKTWNITAVSMGNPHAVVFLDDIEHLPIAELGPHFEKHPLFPNKTNTEFIQVIDKENINMRVWERGAGETLACGTGACAATVAAVLNGHCNREVTVNLLGGKLNVWWDKKTNHVHMRGEAVTVFEGTIKRQTR